LYICHIQEFYFSILFTNPSEVYPFYIPFHPLTEEHNLNLCTWHVSISLLSFSETPQLKNTPIGDLVLQPWFAYVVAIIIKHHLCYDVGGGAS